MALIDCHECGHQVSTKTKVCPGCGTTLVILNGKNYTDMPFASKVGWFVMVSLSALVVAWLLMLGLEWLASGSGVAYRFVSGIYWWMYWGIAILVVIEFYKSLHKGELNS